MNISARHGRLALIGMMNFSMMLFAYGCLVAHANAASAPFFNPIIGNRVYLNDRLQPNDERTFTPPKGKLFVIQIS